MSILDKLFDEFGDKKSYYMFKYINGSFKLMPKAMDNFESRRDSYTICSDPYDIEVMVENFTADNGRIYNACATVTVYLPEEKADDVANMFFHRITFSRNCDDQLRLALTTVVQDALECAVKGYDGVSAEQLEKHFIAEVLKRTLIYHHLTENSCSFAIREVTR